MSLSNNSSSRDELFADNDANAIDKRTKPADFNSKQHLLRARNELQTELDRMKSTAAVVASTSSTISSISSQYSIYQNRISSAGRTLKQLRTKMENDERYIYWSYIVFLLSAMWIFLKRVKVVAISEWLVKKGFDGLSFVTETVPDTPSPSSTTTVPLSTIPPTEIQLTVSPSMMATTTTFPSTTFSPSTHRQHHGPLTTQPPQTTRTTKPKTTGAPSKQGEL